MRPSAAAERIQAVATACRDTVNSCQGPCVRARARAAPGCAANAPLLLVLQLLGGNEECDTAGRLSTESGGWGLRDELLRPLPGVRPQTATTISHAGDWARPPPHLPRWWDSRPTAIHAPPSWRPRAPPSPFKCAAVSLSTRTTQGSSGARAAPRWTHRTFATPAAPLSCPGRRDGISRRLHCRPGQRRCVGRCGEMARAPCPTLEADCVT